MRTVAVMMLVACSPGFAAEPRVLIGWAFDTEGDAEGWHPNKGHVTDVRVAKGCLSARVVDRDPFFVSPVFEIPARHGQWIETRIRGTESGDAEFFWTNTLQTRYGGFSSGKETHFHLIGDGNWHVYRIRPHWEPEGKIIKIRLDLPRPVGSTTLSGRRGDKGVFEVDYVRIAEPPVASRPSEPTWDFADGAEGWTTETGGEQPSVRGGWLLLRSRAMPHDLRGLVSPPVRFPARERFFVTVRMSTSAGRTATLGFANDAQAGLGTRSFPIRADDKPHTYIADLSDHSRWRNVIRLVTFEASDAPNARVAIDFIRVAAEPVGDPELTVRHFGLADGMPRAGTRLAVAAAIVNTGGAPARGLRVALELPRGLRADVPLIREVGDIWYGETRCLSWPVVNRAAHALLGAARFRLSADGLPEITAEATIRIERSLGLPRADYVPEPRPAETDYQVGVYYFPGFPTWSKWRPIAEFPERKPLLGWYDEKSPEVADWQIKWAVEHGISFFAVDWYWCQGGRHLEHWLHDAYFKSRYRRFLKFCLLWANHNPPGTSSESDLLAVTDFWIENYFRRGEYLKVEGKPVVIIFSPHRLTSDLGSEAVAAAFGEMRARCRQARLSGLYIVACTGSGRKTIERLKAEGYDAISGYNYPGLKSGGRRRHPYADNIAGYRELWNEAADYRLLKEIPVLSGGWDSRPWHGQRARVVYGRTPSLFERHCRDAREFLEARDAEMPPRLKMCIVEAWNEWGEGSYIGPHREHGFDYLEAIRRVFAPDSPRPLPVTPRDVGLGPYDCPRPEATASRKAAWDLTKAEDRAEWHMSGQIRPEPNAPSLKGTATGRDPIIGGPAVRIEADALRWLCVEMRTTEADRPQLFWRTTTAGMSENNSVRFDAPGDGRFHTHWIPLGEVPYWTGLITGIRFDPATRPGVAFEIRAIRFARERGEKP